MGFEVELNAIPKDFALFKSAKKGEFDPELISFIGMYFKLRRQKGGEVEKFVEGDNGRIVFADELEKTIIANSGIEDRYLELDRRFDWLRFLLLRASRRIGIKDLSEVCIRGQSKVMEGAISVQGFTVKTTSCELCRDIYLWLESITRRDLESSFSQQAFIDEGLYKWHKAKEPDIIFQDFENLKAFYKRVVEHSEAVIITTS